MAAGGVSQDARVDAGAGGHDGLLPGTVLVFVVALALAALFVRGTESVRRAQAENQALQLARAVAHDLGERLDRSLSASYAMATLVRQGRGRIDNFEAIAREMIEVYGGITALQLAPGGTIAQVVPLAGNERVIGFSPLNDPVQGPETQRAVAQRRLALTGPFDLKQGGVGVLGRNPIFLADETGQETFWGLTQVLIRMPALLAASRINALEDAGYVYALWRIRPDDGSRHVFAATAEALLREPVETRIEVPNGEWVLSVAPVAGWVPAQERILYWSGAMAFALLVATAAFLVLRQPRRLRQEVDRQTAELATRNAWLRSILEHFPGGVAVTDAEGRMTEINERCFALLDLPRQAGDEPPKLIDYLRYNALRGEYGEVDMERFMAQAEENIRHPVAHCFERTRPNGVTLEVRGTPLPGGGFVTSYTDITERKRQEAALRSANQRYEQLTAELEAKVAERTASLAREAEERGLAEAAASRLAVRLREIMDTMPVGIALWDGEQRLLAWNAAYAGIYPRAARLLAEGLPRAELRAAMFKLAYLSEAELQDWDRLGAWDRSLPDGRVIAIQRLQTADGGRLVLNTDVTDLRRTSEVLARNERMASLGSLVAGVAHEINTPIGNALMVASTLGDLTQEIQTAVNGGALRRSALESFLGALQESSAILQRNLMTAARLIQDFKQVAVDQTSDRRRVFDLATVLEEIRMTLAPRFKHTPHRLWMEIPAGLEMDSYPGALGQVVSNLVDNALAHGLEARPAGLVSLEAERQPDGSIQLVCADNGKGMAPDVRARVFDPFFTTRLGQGGSGLGLSIVLNLVRDLLGGEIEVFSSPDTGTRVVLTLPASAPGAGEIPAGFSG